jgi:hypothetical protein
MMVSTDSVRRTAKQASNATAPSGPMGVLLATTGCTAAIAFLAAVTQDSSDGPEWIALALAFALPVAIVAGNGHFGSTSWRIPTPGAFILLFWLLALAPSLISLSTEARMAVSYSQDAVFYGRLVAMAWFWLFALALGRAPAPSLRAVSVEDIGVDGPCFVLVLGLWAACASFASRYDLLSAYRSQGDDLPAIGSTSMSMTLYYAALTPMIAPIALLMRLRGPSTFRTLAGATMLVGGAALFLYSSRRLWVAAIYLCFLIAQTRRAALKKRWLAAAAVALAVGTGPLVFSYRMARIGSTGVSPIDQAWQGIASYAADSDARNEAALASSSNLRVRLGISAILFAITEHELASGPNLSPSLLEPAVLAVPSVVWPDKNEVAYELDAKRQFVATGRFPLGDMPVCPISEFIFQFGPLIAPLGGLVYGLAARLINSTSELATSSLPRFIAWAGAFVAFSFFDGGTLALSGLREPFFLALLLGAFAALLQRRTRAPASHAR